MYQSSEIDALSRRARERARSEWPLTGVSCAKELPCNRCLVFLFNKELDGSLARSLSLARGAGSLSLRCKAAFAAGCAVRRMPTPFPLPRPAPRARGGGASAGTLSCCEGRTRRPWSSSLASWRAAIAASSRSNSLFTTARSACIVFVAQTRSDGLSSLYRRRRRRAGDDLLCLGSKNKRGAGKGSRVFERKTVPTSVLRALASGLSAAAHSTLLAFQNAWPVMHRGSEVLGAVLGACGCALVVGARPTCVGRSAASARC